MARAKKGRGVTDKGGAWRPHRGNRNSFKKTSGRGCTFTIFVLVGLVGMGLALIMIPFPPKRWHCSIRNHEWRSSARWATSGPAIDPQVSNITWGGWG